MLLRVLRPPHLRVLMGRNPAFGRRTHDWVNENKQPRPTQNAVQIAPICQIRPFKSTKIRDATMAATPEIAEPDEEDNVAEMTVSAIRQIRNLAGQKSAGGPITWL